MARKRKPPSVQGEPRTYDPDFHGPTADRYCTDVVCCVVFILFIMGYIVLGLVAWSHGDPRRLAYPTDSKGHYCGQKFTPNENKPVLFYFNVFKCTTSASMMLRLQCPTTQICVSKCPEKFLTYIEMQSLNKNDKNFWDYYRQFCKSTAKPAETLSEIVTHYDCPTAVFPSRPFLQRCFPDFSSTNGTLTIGSKLQFDDGRGNSRSAMELRDASNGMSEILDTKIFWLKVFEDYVVAWKWIIIALTIAMVLSWMFLILLRFTAGFLFWVFMFGVLGIIGYGIWYCYVEYNGLQKKPYSTLMVYNFGIQNNISAFYYLKQTWFFLMIFLSVLEAVIILMLIFLRKRIRVAIILLKEGSKAIGYIPSTLVYPILTVILLSICLSYWAVTAVFLSTSGEPIFKVLDPEGHCSHQGETCDPEIFDQTDIPKVCPGALCNFAFYGGNGVYHKYITTFQLYNLFAFFWLINFVIALDQCTLAGAFATYYWAMRKPDDIPPRLVFTAFGRAVRYHTGSLAFGSLILALTQMFKVIIEYMDRRLKNIQNAFSRFIRCCLKCCFWCFDAVVKFLNRNAYIMIAIYGKSFCESTRNAFNLLMRNILKVAVTDEVTFFVLLLGKMLVSGIVGILAFLLFTERLPKIIEGPTSLNYYWVPLLTIVCGSYLIAHGFFSVYSMCIETIFICFCDDLERNDGSSEKPYFITPTLHGILTKKHPVPPKQSRKAPSSTAHFQV